MSKKPIIHTAKDCGGEFAVLTTEKNVPYLECEKCGHKIEDWIKWDSEYKNYWRDAEKWDSKRDAVVCLLGYFSELYTKHYGVDFVFSLNDKGLFRGSEAHQIRKMYGLLANNAKVSKKYLDWVFETKVGQKKRKITSLGFLATPAIVNEFNLLQQKNKRITRSTALPNGMTTWLKSFAPETLSQVVLKDFGDLHSLLTHYGRGHLNDHEQTKIFVQKLVSSGVIDQNLKIKNWSE